MTMQMVEYRRFIRHPLCLPLSYRLLEKRAQKAQNTSQSINISLGGLLFSSKHPVHPLSKIAIKMPFESKVFNIKAQVLRCSQNSDNKLYEIAVRFPRTQEAFKAKMIEQLYLIAGYRDLLRLQRGKDVSLEEASRQWIKKYSARFKRLYW